MRLLFIDFVLDKVLYICDHFLWLSKDKKNNIKIKIKKEILMVLNIRCINWILLLNIFSKFF